MTHQHRPRTDTRRWICRERSRADLDQVHIDKRADRLFFVRAIPLVFVDTEPETNTIHVFATDGDFSVTTPAIIRKLKLETKTLVVLLQLQRPSFSAPEWKVRVMIPKRFDVVFFERLCKSPFANFFPETKERYRQLFKNRCVAS